LRIDEHHDLAIERPGRREPAPFRRRTGFGAAEKRHRTSTPAWALFFLCANAIPTPSAAQVAPEKRILVLYSFGHEYFSGFGHGFRTELARLSTEPVELFEVSVEPTRFPETTAEAPFVDYLRALIGDRHLDLVIAVAGPAARFCVKYHEVLFPSTPMVLGGLEERVLRNTPSAPLTTAVPLTIDFTMAVENILRVAPDTAEIVVVLGGSAISKFWLAETQREFQSFSDRVRFTWLHSLSLKEMKERVAALPPSAAILFGEYGDAGEDINGEDHGLASLHRVASVPMFGLFDTQLGEGIVGGPLVSEAEASRQTASAAHRILRGEPVETIEETTVTAGSPVYDFRELERWGIEEARLPPGSRVLFRPTSLWSEYRVPVVIGLGVVGLQTALIVGLFLHRSRRRVAEEEARGLARRLLTAQEDERRRVARELHDDLSQRLARLSIDAALVERSLSPSPERESTRTMRADITRLSDDVHALAYQLHPSVLDELGLNEALKVECEQFSRRESIDAQLTSFEAPSEISTDVSVCLFRIAQEALRNAARHSRASRVNLAVTTANGSLRMTVSDDGVGFLPTQRRVRSLGHASMRERARLVGGGLDIESAPGRGTTVDVSVPLKNGSP
jgi:signal transduction histidine kinase